MQNRLRSSSVVRFRLAVAASVFLTAIYLPMAHASGGGGGHGAKKSAATEKAPSVPSVTMPMLVAPIVVKGLLVRYVYLNVTLVLPDDSNKMMLLEKIPYIQDAFLYEVHGTPIALNDDPDVLDEEGLGRRLLSACAKIVGSDIVKKVDFRDSTKDFK